MVNERRIHWVNTLDTRRINVIECLDSGWRRIWIKFEPVDRTAPMEVCNILDQPSKVDWALRNSHFETIDGRIRSNYYPANMAGSFHIDAGTTTLNKDRNSKIVLFPITRSGCIDIQDYTLAGNQFEIVSSMPLWVGYVVSGSGSINPMTT